MGQVLKYNPPCVAIAMTRSVQITKQQLEEMFAHIRAESEWDPEGEMVWGYFFVDRDQSALERAASELEQQGYQLVGIFEFDDDEDEEGDESAPANSDEPELVLHVEKTEAHTVDSLDARNATLCEFAERHGLLAYDGMDVGPIEDTDE